AGVGDPDAVQVRALAYEASLRAGERAKGLGAPEIALRAFRDAAGLSDDELEAARLLEQAAVMARTARRDEDAAELFRSAAAAHDAAGRARDAVRLQGLGASARIAEPVAALAALREAYDILAQGEPDAAYAEIALRLGRLTWMQGNVDAATMTLLDNALAVGEALAMPDLVTNGLVTKGGFLQSQGRDIEAAALYTFALQVALDAGDSPGALDAYGNLTDSMLGSDRPGLVELATDGLALARRLGDRGSEQVLLSNIWLQQIFTGDWSQVEATTAEAMATGRNFGDVHARLALLLAWRGDPAAAATHVEALTDWLTGEDLQDRQIGQAAIAAVHLAGGRPAEAIELAGQVVDTFELGLRRETFRVAWPTAVEASLELNRAEETDRLLAIVGDRPPGHVPPYLRAQLARFRALRSAGLATDEAVEADHRAAVAAFSALGYPYWLARAQIDLGHWLANRGRDAEAGPLLSSGQEVLAQLGLSQVVRRADQHA
ncbi:MAG: hypothetical protein ACRDWY_07975, partial [Actinomycetes bacterium]